MAAGSMISRQNSIIDTAGRLNNIYPQYIRVFDFFFVKIFVEKEKRKSRQLPHSAESATQAAAYLWGVVSRMDQSLGPLVYF